ncbi:MAG TPA: hypothetical protein VFR90_10275 [Methylibium sp.]|uniref:hypothetical protein n=1 Tax=Methylibium sp. TaxID=2067992 RepID=UPI002DB58A66|nr:hypothetical protein [Methylibium sp.]HEU4459497.1 hypothetical protein [Methylibium sp.]
MTPAWTVGAWPTALWQPGRDLPLHFVHLGTHVSSRLSPEWPSMGQTVWGGRAGDAAAGISWDWIEVAEGIVAIADPMMMTSNLRLIGSEGEVLTAHEAAPHLNRFVRSLPWQAEIWRMLELERQSGALVAAERNSRTGATPSSIGISMPLGGTPN